MNDIDSEILLTFIIMLANEGNSSDDVLAAYDEADAELITNSAKFAESWLDYRIEYLDAVKGTGMHKLLELPYIKGMIQRAYIHGALAILQDQFNDFE